MSYLTDAYHVGVIDYLRWVQSPFVSGIELWGPGIELVLQSLVRKEQDDKNFSANLSSQTDWKSTELKAEMLCDDTWLSISTDILIKVSIDLI